MDSVLSIVLLCAFVGIIVLNFVFQFYVGARVYGGGVGIIRSLNGTKTFIRGWQDSSLRPIMILWSGVVALVVLGVCGAAGLGGLAQ